MAFRSALSVPCAPHCPTRAKNMTLPYEIKDFPDSTAVLLAIEQGALDIGNTTSQHLIRAISEGIPVTWISGWGGGYNVLVARKDLGLKPNDPKGLKAMVDSRNHSGKPLSFRGANWLAQHAKLAVISQINRHRSRQGHVKSAIFRSRATLARCKRAKSIWQ